MDELVSVTRPIEPAFSTPLIRSGERNLKNSVIDTLARRWPLNARQIYREIAYEPPGHSITYQGVHKALRQLREQGVIEITENGNRLNYEWISQMREYCGNIHQNYTIGKNTDFYEIPDGDSLTLEYPNYFRAVQSVCEIIARNAEKTSEPDEILVNSAHPFPIIGLPFGMLERIRKLTREGKFKFKGIHGSNTKTDRELAGLWNQTGVEWNHSKKASTAKGYNLLTRDLLIQFATSPQFNRQASQIVRKSSKVAADKIYEYTALCESSESRTALLITKNAALVRNLRAGE